MPHRPWTLVLSYYDQPKMLEKQLLHRMETPYLRDWHMVVVDDGSPNHPVPALGIPRTTVYRVHKDVRWNVEGARNIGMSDPPTSWCLITDIDHLVSPELALYLGTADLDAKRFYTFSRQGVGGQEKNAHCNSFAMTWETWWRIGGCDERLSGFYGGSNEFNSRAVARVGAAVEIGHPLIFVGNETVEDACVTGYGRRTEDDLAARPRIRREIQDNPGPVRFRLPYHKVE